MLLKLDAAMWKMWLGRLDLPAVVAADEIGLFVAVNKGKNSIGLLAKALGLDKHGLDALCVFLASMNLLEKRSEKITLTELSENYLLPLSEAYWGPAFNGFKKFLEYSHIISSLQGTKKAVELNDKNLSHIWKAGTISYQKAEKITQVMHSTIFASAQSAVNYGVFKNTKALLDVGAGSACFISLLARKYPQRNYGVFDLPAVCEVTKKHLLKADINHQIKFYAGNFFNDRFPAGFDGMLFSNVLHDWPKEIAILLAKKAYDALPDGGKIFIHEMLLNMHKNGPKIPAAFNLLMYLNHKSQQFMYDELVSILQEAGFSSCCLEKTHPLFSTVVAVK